MYMRVLCTTQAPPGRGGRPSRLGGRARPPPGEYFIKRRFQSKPAQNTYDYSSFLARLDEYRYLMTYSPSANLQRRSPKGRALQQPGRAREGGGRGLGEQADCQELRLVHALPLADRRPPERRRRRPASLLRLAEPRDGLRRRGRRLQRRGRRAVRPELDRGLACTRARAARPGLRGLLRSSSSAHYAGWGMRRAQGTRRRPIARAHRRASGRQPAALFDSGLPLRRRPAGSRGPRPA